jgi:hypothetical protein
MQATSPRHVYWSYSYGFKQTKDFADPRVAVARQIAWAKTTSDVTDYSTPEPDNYNRAIFMSKPWECPLIEDQVVYYDSTRQGWITVMHVPEEQSVEVDQWIYTQPTLAVWRHLKPPRVKQQRKYLYTRDNKSASTLTDNERLYTMGYYDNLKTKYFSDDATYVDSLLGESRDLLKNFVPEEQSDTDDDNSSVILV